MNNKTLTRATDCPGLAFFLARLAFVALVAAILVDSRASDAHAQSSEAKVVQSTGTTMGPVPYNVLAWKSSGDEELTQESLDKVVAETLESVNQSMSTYIETSEVSRFNSSDSTDWFAVSPQTMAVVEKALQISEATDGAFDITVQPLVQLWKFGTDKDKPRVPTQAEIDSALATIGHQKLAVQEDPPAIKKSVPELKIDLSAIAKGYAVDQIAERLNDLDVDNYMIEVGGEVRTAGEKPSKTGWRIGIEKPVAGERAPFKIVELYHKALAGSGDYRNFYEIDGKRYSHTIDPRTGRPVEHGVSAASVISNDCMTADAVATAIMVLGSKEGLAVAKKLNVAAVVMTRSGNQTPYSRNRRLRIIYSRSIKSGW